MEKLFGSTSGLQLASVENLAIVNDPTRPIWCDIDYCFLRYEKWGCKRIRNLSWKSLHPSLYRRLLTDLFLHNASHLESLELDVLWCDTFLQVGNEKMSQDLFSTVQLRQSQDGSVFPALKSLALSKVSFLTRPNNDLFAFNFGNLRSLEFHNCWHISKCLSNAAASMKEITVKSLKLSIIDDGCENDEFTLLRFLTNCSSLEELCLLLKPGMETPYYWDAILSSGPPLKRLLYHERLNLGHHSEMIIVDHRDVCPCETRQTYYTSVPPFPRLDDPFCQLFSRTELEFLATSNCPTDLVSKPYRSCHMI